MSIEWCRTEAMSKFSNQHLEVNLPLKYTHNVCYKQLQVASLHTNLGYWEPTL